MPDTTQIILLSPVVMWSETITALNVREPVAKELVKFDQVLYKDGGVQAFIELAGLASDQPKPVIERLCSRDYRQVEVFFRPFVMPPIVAAAPETGQT